MNDEINIRLAAERETWRRSRVSIGYIAPQFRRRGVYRRLYQFVKELAAKQEEVRGFRLYVEKENRTAQRTYERLGMSESHYLMFEELSQTKV